jgi:hypothetical protein
MSVPATTFRVPKTEDWDMEIRLSEIKSMLLRISYVSVGGLIVNVECCN